MKKLCVCCVFIIFGRHQPIVTTLQQVAAICFRFFVVVVVVVVVFVFSSLLFSVSSSKSATLRLFFCFFVAVLPIFFSLVFRFHLLSSPVRTCPCAIQLLKAIQTKTLPCVLRYHIIFSTGFFVFFFLFLFWSCNFHSLSFRFQLYSQQIYHVHSAFFTESSSTRRA
jgi:hypothetical protein